MKCKTKIKVNVKKYYDQLEALHKNMQKKHTLFVKVCHSFICKTTYCLSDPGKGYGNFAESSLLSEP